MFKSIKLSIITVSFNSVHTIEETIKSVLNQSYSNIQYIIIDGGSTDGTIEVIKKYKDKISVWISEPDKGIYDAMNKGIKLANGDWIGIINSDDFFCIDAFNTVCNIITKNPSSELIFGDLNIIDENSKFVNKIKPNLQLDHIKHTMSIFHPTVFIKKESYLNHGMFDLKYKLSADWDLLKRFYLSGVKFYYIDKPIANFRKGGAGSGFRIIHLFERFKIRHDSFEFYFIWYDIKDFLILMYYKFFPNKPLF